jgi:hypothetical protein
MIKPIAYLREMLDALTSGYNRADVRNARHGLPLETNIGRLFSTLAWGLQHIHEHTDKILEWDNIDNAQGAVLDRFGANFGVARNGANDAFFRLSIKIKMIAMLSGGDIDTVLNAAAALFDVPVESVELKEVFPAKLSIHVDETLLSDEIREVAALINQLLKRILAAGVGFDVSLDTNREFETAVYFMSGAFLASEVKADIVTRPRVFDNPLYFGSAGLIVSEITAQPLPRDRINSRNVYINSAVFEYVELTASAAN